MATPDEETAELEGLTTEWALATVTTMKRQHSTGLNHAVLDHLDAPRRRALLASRDGRRLWALDLAAALEAEEERPPGGA